MVSSLLQTTARSPGLLCPRKAYPGHAIFRIKGGFGVLNGGSGTWSEEVLIGDIAHVSESELHIHRFLGAEETSITRSQPAATLSVEVWTSGSRGS